MEEVYRDYRIAITATEGGWIARITHVRGSVAPFKASATVEEGSESCARKCRDLIDRYVEFLSTPDERLD